MLITQAGDARGDNATNAGLLSSCSHALHVVQTGAGKTYTMSGEGQQYSRRGITPRALHHIFEQIDIRVDRQMTVRVSFVEVYNEVGSLLPCCLLALPYIAQCSTVTVRGF